ncbi:MAG: hypothetical protein HY300_17640 [Verrucomicrobia bacterium]|nr:hypothetical protein [Verrucomicrobiota bacterium]
MKRRSKGQRDSLNLTQSEIDAIHKEEVTKILPSVTVDKALQHLGLLKEARQSKLGDVNLFWYLRLTEERRLDHPKVLDAITAAAKRDDKPFFIDLGRLLGKPPVTEKEIKANLTPLEGFLLRNWNRPDRDLQFSLCYYNDPALLKFLRFYSEVAGYSFPALSPDTLEKTWTRLGLKKAKQLLFRDVRIERGVIHPIPFKKLRQ